MSALPPIADIAKIAGVIELNWYTNLIPENISEPILL